MSLPGLSRRSGITGGIISALIPARTKRVVVLSSLYAILRGDEPSLTQLTALNSTLNLAKDVAALKLPARIPKAFWRKADQIARKRDPADQQTFILECLPKSLTYGKKLDIASDIHALLQFVEIRKASTQVSQESSESVRVVATA